MTITTSVETVANDSLTPSQEIEEIIHLEQVKKGIEKKLEIYRKNLLEVMRRDDVLTLKTGKFTITRATRTTIKITDDKLVKEQLENMGHQVMTKEVIDMKYMKPVITDNVDQLDGVSKSETEYTSIKLTK